jgi:hypothetical protein
MVGCLRLIASTAGEAPMGLHTLPLLRTTGSLDIERHGSAIACWRWAVKLLLASICVWSVKPSIACNANNQAHVLTVAYKR